MDKALIDELPHMYGGLSQYERVVFVQFDIYALVTTNLRL